MATKSMAYDHPAYTAVYSDHTGQLSGSAGVGTKAAAFTNLLIKSITLKPTTAGTSNDVFSFLSISGTTTTTTALCTFGSGVTTFTNVALTTNNNLLQGDTWWVQKGTDATGTYIGMFEWTIVPGANVTQ